MGGKASLYMILGFSLIFLVAGFNFSSLTRRSVTNGINYYNETISHNLALSGANMAANATFLDKTCSNTYNLSLNNGTLNATIQHLSGDQIKITSIGSYQNAADTIIVQLRPSSFAKFGYYMNIFPSSMFFYTGDTLSGPFHTQQYLYTRGTPVFNGKVTINNSWVNNDPSSPKKTPTFLGGYKEGVSIPLNTDVSSAKTAALSGGKYLTPSNASKDLDVRLTFNSGGTVTFNTRYTGTSTWSADSTRNLSTWAPNGVIYVNKGNLYVHGTVNGQYTIVADKSTSSSSSCGTVYLEDDIKYHNTTSYDATTRYYNVNGNDALGIVASGNIEIVDNTANRSNIEINAALYSITGGLHIANESMPVSGYIKLIGGLTEYQAQVTGKVSGSSLVNGYNEKIYFDQRFSDIAPPYYPTTGKLEVVSWFETTWFPNN
jgi:hypothetical protein